MIIIIKIINNNNNNNNNNDNNNNNNNNVIFRLILKPISKFLKFQKFENEKRCPEIMLFCFFFLLTSDSFINKYYLKLIEISERKKKSYISYSIIRAWPNLGNF